MIRIVYSLSDMEADAFIYGIKLRCIVNLYLGKHCAINTCWGMELGSRHSSTRCFSDRASWIDYILITDLMHWLLFIHKILISSTYFEPQVIIFRWIQLYTCSIWYCHCLWEFVVACRYTAWVTTHSSCVPTSHHELS